MLQAAGFSKRVFDPDTVTRVIEFIFDRLAGALREQAYSAHEVEAVLALRPRRLGEVPKRLAAVRAFAARPEAEEFLEVNDLDESYAKLESKGASSASILLGTLGR